MFGRIVQEADHVEVTFRSYKGYQGIKGVIIIRIIVTRDKERLNSSTFGSILLAPHTFGGMGWQMQLTTTRWKYLVVASRMYSIPC